MDVCLMRNKYITLDYCVNLCFENYLNLFTTLVNKKSNSHFQHVKYLCEKLKKKKKLFILTSTFLEGILKKQPSPSTRQLFF